MTTTDQSPPAASPEAANPLPEHRAGPLSPFRFAGFQRLWVLTVCSNGAFNMQLVVNSYWMYELTRSALQVGLLGLARALPLLFLSLYGGAIADRVDRKLLMLFTQGSRALLSGVLVLLAWAGALDAWHIYAVTALSAGATIFDGPARQALLPILVPRAHVTSAIVLNSVTNQLMKFIGPTLAGMAIAIWAGPVAAYGLNTLLFVVGWLTVCTIQQPPRPVETVRQSVLHMMREGVGFVRSRPVILSLMLLDFFASIFSAYDALLPVFAKEVLHVGPEGFGVLASAPSLGAFIGSATVLTLFTNAERKGRTALIAVSAYGLAILLFSTTSALALSCVALALAGAADQTAVTMRNATILLMTPNDLRGRVESIRLTFIQGGPQLGAAQLGAVAGVIGAPLTLTLGAVAVLGTVGLVFLRVPELWRVRVK